MNPLALEFPEEFCSERLRIRAYREGDGAALNAGVLESLAELRPWMPWAQAAPTVEESEAVCRAARLRFLAREDLTLGLFLLCDGAFVGGSGLHRIDWGVPRFEIGFWLRTSLCGRGLATEAVRAIAGFAFGTLRAERVEIRCDSRNARSAAVALRAGFAHEATLHHDSRGTDGALRDTQIYVRLR
jgi:RimJ/RimL family protein N-acetyltransferase